MMAVSQEHNQAPGRKFFFLHGVAVLAMVLMSTISVETRAQDEEATCPCFSYEEVEAIFQRSQQLTEEEGTSACHVEDFSVECNAEIAIWDQDYAVIAQARVDWFDFDPSRCGYVDNTSNPGVERDINWPHPAPEAMARACYKIISSIIAKLDTSGKCETYP